jgi:hypothetical protein
VSQIMYANIFNPGELSNTSSWSLEVCKVGSKNPSNDDPRVFFDQFHLDSDVRAEGFMPMLKVAKTDRPHDMSAARPKPQRFVFAKTKIAEAALISV